MAKAKVYRPRTLSCLRIYLRSQLLPAFGRMRLDRITVPAMAAWFHGYSRARPGGANQALGYFTTILNWEKEGGLVARSLPNPADPIRKNRRAPRGRMLNSEDLGRLFAVLANTPARFRNAAAAIELILLTGCRSGEIMRLRWHDVEDDRLVLPRTKTGPRDVLLAPLPRERLAEMHECRPSSPFVFPSPLKPGHPRAHVSGAWATIKQLADLPDALRLHDLRHTYASHAILAEESLHATGKLLGHRRTDSTERYAHLDGTAFEKAAEGISREVERMMGDGIGSRWARLGGAQKAESGRSLQVRRSSGD